MRLRKAIESQAGAYARQACRTAISRARMPGRKLASFTSARCMETTERALQTCCHSDGAISAIRRRWDQVGIAG